MPWRKSDVEKRYNRGTWRPAVNVKASCFGWDVARAYEAEGYSDSDVERALRYVWDSHAELFWDHADEAAALYLGSGVKVVQEGRSGGWAVVEGLAEIETWDAIAVMRWGRFAVSLACELNHLTNAHTIRDTIEANEWLPDLAAQQRAAAWAAEYHPGDACEPYTHAIATDLGGCPRCGRL